MASADHSDMPEGQTLSSGKKLIRKVKKGAAATGINKTEMHQIGFGAAGTINLTGSSAMHTKTGHKSINLQ